MTVRPFSPADLPLLDAAGGYARQYGKNITRWMTDGYVEAAGCYVFDNGGALLGGVCFRDDTSEEMDILDFAATEIAPDAHDWLAQALRQAAKPATRKVSYHLYDDTEQFGEIQRLFRRAGFYAAQEKLQYAYEKPEAPVCPDASRFDALRFKSIAETGEEMFVEMVERVTVGTLDKLMADDAARLGSRRAAQEFVDSLKEIDFNPSWWQLAYAGDLPVGLILSQRFSESLGAINYIGAPPEHRGRGYGLALLAEGTRILVESGITRVIADIDIDNKPLAAALERLGYVFKMEEVILSMEIPA